MTRYCFFQNEAQKNISNKVAFHYVLRGLSATIGNIRFGKDFYIKGENADVIFDWMPSADSFFGSRAGHGTKFENASAEFSVTDQNGVKCGEPVKKAIEIGKYKENLIIPVITDCFNPQIKVVVKDAQGNVLDENTFKITSKSQAALAKIAELANAKTNIKNILLIIFILLFVAVVIYAVFRKKQINGIKILLVAGGVLTGMFFGVNDAKAVTWSVSGVEDKFGVEITSSAVYTATLNKSIYSPEEKAIVSGLGSGGVCSNGWQYVKMDLIYPITSTVFVYSADPELPVVSGEAYFITSIMPGNYNITLRGWTMANYGDAPIPYTVSGSLPKCNASFSPDVVNKGDSTTLTWTSSDDFDNKIPYSCDGDIGSGTLSPAITGSKSFGNIQSDTQICTLEAEDKFGNKSQCSATVEAVDNPSCDIWFFKLIGGKITQVVPDDSFFMKWTSLYDNDLLLPSVCVGDISGTKNKSWSTGGASFFLRAYENYSCTAEVKNSLGKTATCTGSIALDCSDTTKYCTDAEIGTTRCVSGVLQTCVDWHSEDPKTNSCNKWTDTGVCGGGFFNLIVNNNSNGGTGTVTDNSIPIKSCAAAASPCIWSYLAGTNVVLTENVLTGTFGGWSNDAISCGNNPSCGINMDSDKTVTATFGAVCVPNYMCIPPDCSGNCGKTLPKDCCESNCLPIDCDPTKAKCGGCGTAPCPACSIPSGNWKEVAP